MNEIKGLKDENFLQINYNNKTYYGGNQSWWEQHNSKFQAFGCGIIAMCNLELYFKGVGDISYDEYVSYVNRRYEENYSLLKGTVFSRLGLLPWKMKKGIELFLNCTNQFPKVKVKWSPTLSRGKILAYIGDMLENNLPITASYFSFKKSKYIRFYQLNSDKNTMDKVSKCTGHYFSITGIVELSSSKEKYFRVSSWGKMYYIKVDDWIDKLSYFTNILYITF